MRRALSMCLALATIACEETPPPVPPAGIAFEEIDLEGDYFTDLAWVPGRDGELLIATHPGELIHYRVEGDRAERLGAIAVPEVVLMGDCGLLAVALDPGWEDNGFVYAGHCTGTTYATRITRLTWDGSSYDVASTARVILEVEETRGRNPFNHNVSNILFEDDGTMVVGVGDKGARDFTGQDPTNLPSTIMRIVPSRDPRVGGYTPAPGNAFDDPADGAPEVYAYGLRYPWRIARDRRGRFIAGDVGEGGYEEVNVIRAPGENFGWPACQGACDPPRAEFVDPVTAWPHTDDHPYVYEDAETLPGPRRVVWVAPVRPELEEDPFAELLDDTFLFGDTCTGWVRGATLDDEGELARDRFLAHLPWVTGWIWAPDGLGYVTTFGSCDAVATIEEARLYRVVPRYEED